MYACMHVRKRVSDSPETDISDCELPNVGAGNGVQVLCKCSRCS